VGEASAYELTKAMRRNLRFFWPRAEARIYAEAKRLAEAGLASATRGRRAPPPS
jgi:PadR family transcriptional regulator, regulatory protein AphA